MRVISFCFMLLFIREIKNINIPSSGSEKFNLALWYNGNLIPQSPPGLGSNPCDTAVNKGELDAQLACHNECMTLKAELRNINYKFPDYRTTQYLHYKCGMVTEGKCSTAPPSRICWCQTLHESKDPRSSTLKNCRSSIEIMRKFINAISTTAKSDISARGKLITASSHEVGWTAENEAVHMYQGPPPSWNPSEGIPKGRRSDRKRRANAGLMSSCCGLGGRRLNSPDGESSVPFVPAPPQTKGKEKAETSSGRRSASPGLEEERPGVVLYTTMKASGRTVRAIVDTGAAFCLFHPNIAGNNIVHTDYRISSVGDQNSFKVTGKAKVRLWISTGVTIPVTGYVVTRRFDILLGTDFFIAYAAKINLAEKTMDINSGLATVNMIVEFVTVAQIGMMNLYHEGYTSLLISARLNGKDTKVCIDTGSSNSIVTRNVVQEAAIRPTKTDISYGGSEEYAEFLGRARIALMIELNSVSFAAYIPTFTPHVDLITGNDFNEKYVTRIDYEAREVTLKLPSPAGLTQITTHAFLIEGE